MNDYSILFKNELEEMASEKEKNSVEKQLNIWGRFIREHYEANSELVSIEKIKEAIKAKLNIWDIPWL